MTQWNYTKAYQSHSTARRRQEVKISRQAKCKTLQIAQGVNAAVAFIHLFLHGERWLRSCCVPFRHSHVYILHLSGPVNMWIFPRVLEMGIRVQDVELWPGSGLNYTDQNSKMDGRQIWGNSREKDVSTDSSENQSYCCLLKQSLSLCNVWFALKCSFILCPLVFPHRSRVTRRLPDYTSCCPHTALWAQRSRLKVAFRFRFNDEIERMQEITTVLWEGNKSPPSLSSLTVFTTHVEKLMWTMWYW